MRINLSPRPVNKVQLIWLIILLILLSVGVGKALSLGSSRINFILFGSLIFINIGFIFITDRRFILALYLLIIANLDYFRLLQEPFNLTLDILFTLTLIILTLPLLLTGKISWRQTPIQKAFILYLAATLLCAFLSVDPLLSIKRWFRYASYYLLICLILDVAKDKAIIKNFSRIIIYSALAPCMLGYYALATRSPSLVSENLRVVYGIDMVRIQSTFSHANTFGLFLGITLTLSIGFLLRSDDFWKPAQKSFLIFMLVMMFPLLYFTFSRIGWISTSLAIILLLVFLKKWRILTIIPWLFGLFIWRLPGFITRWSDVINPMQPDSLDWRRGLYTYSLKKFIEKPFFGSGPGTFLQYVAFGKGYNPHQLWTGSLVEVGAVGTAALFVLLLVVWLQLLKYIKQRPSILNYCSLAIFSSLLFVSIGGDPFGLPSAIIYLWVLISLVQAEYILHQTDTQVQPT
jgi:O-antigen ligase